MLIGKRLWQTLGSLSVETSCIMNCIGIWIAPTSNANTENSSYSKPSLFSKTGGIKIADTNLDGIAGIDL